MGWEKVVKIMLSGKLWEQSGDLATPHPHLQDKLWELLPLAFPMNAKAN